MKMTDRQHSGLFIGVWATAFVLIGVRFALFRATAQAAPETPGFSRLIESKPGPPATLRKTVPPTGTFTPTLTRLTAPPGQIIGMSDRGDHLFVSDLAKREVSHVYRGKVSKIDSFPLNVRPVLSPNGGVFSEVGDGKLVRRFESYSLLDYQSRSLYFNDDGSFFDVETVVDGVYPNHKTILRRATHELKLAPGDTICTEQRTTIKTLFEAPDRIWVLAKVSEQELWIGEQINAPNIPYEIVHLRNGKVSRFTLPAEFTSIGTFAENGDYVVGTFFGSAAPRRAFILKGKTWNELPIPRGYYSSFVNEVLDGGLILGTVYSQDQKEFRQVAWKGDSVCILNDLPAWPKTGRVSIIEDASRNGDIYIRAVEVKFPEVVSYEDRPIIGKSEFYLLNLKDSRR